MKNVKLSWIKNYLITSLLVSGLILIVGVIDLNLLYNKAITFIILLIMCFILSYPIVAVSYLISKQKVVSTTLLIVISGVVWLFFSYALYQFVARL